jgi:branched-chain amino acid transport system ATP-binding protein
LLLEVKKITVFYGTVQALNNISLVVNEGEIVAMIGPNGAGKSTALKAICGLLKETDGEIMNGDVFFKGESIRNIPTYDLVKKGISLIPEGRRVFPSMTVFENLEMGGYIKEDKKNIIESFEKIFSLFPILKERKKQKAGTLSSGEQQMLAIGRALMLEPKLLLLDEPSLGLSPNYVEDVFEKIEEINKNGTSVLLVEQNARVALEHADRGYVFKIGEIAKEGESKELLKSEEIRRIFLA